jgi:hypothetical protein
MRRVRFLVVTACAASLVGGVILFTGAPAAVGAPPVDPVDPTTCVLTGFVTFSPSITPFPTTTTPKFHWMLRKCVGSNNLITKGNGTTVGAPQTVSCSSTGVTQMATSGLITWIPAVDANNNLAITTNMVVSPNAGNVSPSPASAFTAGAGPAGAAQTPPANTSLPWAPGQVLGGTVLASGLSGCVPGAAISALKFTGWLTFWS